MREGWALNQYDSNSSITIAFPFVCYDDGSPLSESDLSEYTSRYSEMTGNDSTSSGEKPVSHVKAYSTRISSTTSSGVLCNGRPLSFSWSTMGSNSWTFWYHELKSSLNRIHERTTRYYSWSTPQDSDCWYDVEWTFYDYGINNRYGPYYWGHGTCSESYASMRGIIDPSNVDFGKKLTYTDFVTTGQHSLFTRCPILDQQFSNIIRITGLQHSMPSGLESELYRNAMNSITCDANSIANIKDAVDLVRDIKHGELFSAISNADSMTKAAANIWLGYRYTYSTTKSDVESYAKNLKRIVSNRANTPTTVRSGATTSYGTAHCKVVYTDQKQNEVCELYKKFKRLGLAIDPYNAWDMVPFSFVVDWFLPIGDVLEDYSSNWVANTGMFTIRTITTSWKWTDSVSYVDGNISISSYTRWVTSKPPEFESYSEDPSTGTVIKRFIDGASLIIG